MKSALSLGKGMAILLMSLLQIHAAAAQQEQGVRGMLKGGTNGDAVSYATVALYRLPDSTMVGGTASDAMGSFFLKGVTLGRSHFIRVTHVGYQTLTQQVPPQAASVLNMGIIPLQEQLGTISELVVSGAAVVAKAEGGKVSYLLHAITYQTAQTGVDALKSIPGLQVDFMQNVSLEGNRNVVLLIDGKERDISFVRQLSAKNIEKVEVQTSPDARYSSEKSGVINIILKDPVSGFSGSVHAEVPTSQSEVYLFPSSSFSFVHGRFNLYSSYSGEVKRLNLFESRNQTIIDGANQTTITQDQQVVQREQLHRLTYGLDFHASKRDMLGIYGYVSRFTQQFNGNVDVGTTENGQADTRWMERKDNDTNRQLLSSLYYRHQLASGGEVSTELCVRNLKSESISLFRSNGTSGADSNGVETSSKPNQNTLLLKVDYAQPTVHNLTLYAGVRSESSKMDDTRSGTFGYREYSQAAYGKVAYGGSTLLVNVGLRLEHQLTELNGRPSRRYLFLSPSAEATYTLTAKQTVGVTFRSTSNHPSLYLLNPVPLADGYSGMRAGNSNLESECRYYLSVNHTLKLGRGVASSQVFVQKVTHATGYLTSVASSHSLYAQAYNLGTITQVGVLLSGAFRIGQSVALNPYLKLFESYTDPYRWVAQYGVLPKRKGGFESGLSAAVTLKNSWAVSLIYQYSSPRVDIQTETFSDALYFVSVTKTIRNKLMVGVTSALPFKGTFTYAGSRTNGYNFRRRTDGVVSMSTVPILFKVSYQLSSGRTTSGQSREPEPFVPIPQKGF